MNRNDWIVRFADLAERFGGGRARSDSGRVLISVDSGYWLHVAPGPSLLGPGIGMVFSAAFNGGTIGVDPEDSGVASATPRSSPSAD